MQLIALTGATGFIGRRILHRLAASGARIRALTRRRPPQSGDGVEWVQGDLLDPPALQSLVRGAAAVIHLAAATGGARQAAFARTNVAGTRCLADAAFRFAPGAHLVHVSSLAAREPGLSWYAASKFESEEAVRSRLKNWTILRPPAVYGPEDRALADFWRALARGWLLRAGPPEARFSLLHVEDLAEACERLIRCGALGDTLELDDGQPEGWSWPAIAACAEAAGAGPVRTVPVPLGLLGAAARANLVLGRLTGRDPILVPGKVRELAHGDWVCDTSRLEAHLHWRPATQLRQSLASLPGWDESN